jgi:hypothetical protein
MEHRVSQDPNDLVCLFAISIKRSQKINKLFLSQFP